MNYLKKNFIHSLILLTGTISLVGAIFYKLHSLNKINIMASLILAVLVFAVLQYFLNKSAGIIKNLDYSSKKIIKRNRWQYVFLSMYALLFLACLYFLISYKTDEAIISPWQILPNIFFIFYFLACVFLFINILIIKVETKIILFLISLHYFLSFAVAIILYKIGYGFDPFIHGATLDLIDKTGSVEPKPFYYLGQYSLIIILHKLTFIPIAILNKFLVPFLSALFIPASFFLFLQKYFKNKTENLLLTLFVLILPFSFLIITTPQNLSYLFLLLIIIYGLACSNMAELSAVYLLSLATLLIHPIAGVPACFFSLFLTIYHSDYKLLKKYLYSAVFVLSSISLPLAFYFTNKNLSANDNSSANIVWPFEKLINPHQDNFILNFIYLYIFNFKVIFVAMALAGVWLVCKHREKCRIFFISLFMSISLFISYFLTQKISFAFLINYEQNSYTDRILTVSAFFLLPFAIVFLRNLLNKIMNNKNIKFPALIFLSIITTTSLYMSYPRFDNYFNSKGYSTGKNDLEAVNWIEKNAGENYIVLANQQVSVAALYKFGFNRYYNNDIYFYPIPTSGQLYRYYLDMVYDKPTKKTMTDAMDFAGVNKAYFVLNKYWWAFPKLLEEAKLEADSWEKIGDGEVYVFGYDY